MGTDHNKTWGYHGYEKIVRDGRGLIVCTSTRVRRVICGKSHRCYVRSEMVFADGPECIEYRFDTVSDEDRDRLEREIGAKFKRGDR